MVSDSTLSQYGDGASHELSNFDYQNLSLYEKLLRLSFMMGQKVLHRQPQIDF